VPVAKRERFEKRFSSASDGTTKVLFATYYELVPHGRTINEELYSQQLEKMYTALVEKYPALVNRERVLLQQDKARPHTANKTLQKIEELEGIELLPHPAFSHDLEPSDYHLFRSMAQFLRGKNFNL
jgi:histone-lysine N-methyltransferase SETMAR